MPTRGRLRLVIGPVGAGKSTFSRQLCAEHHALALNLDAWMARTDDPLLAHAGVVPPPPGAQVNRMDAVSPNEPADLVG